MCRTACLPWRFRDSNSLTTASCPLPLAQESGVLPPSSFEPASTSERAICTVTWPCSLHAS